MVWCTIHEHPYSYSIFQFADASAADHSTTLLSSCLEGGHYCGLFANIFTGHLKLHSQTLPPLHSHTRFAITTLSLTSTLILLSHWLIQPSSLPRPKQTVLFACLFTMLGNIHLSSYSIFYLSKKKKLKTNVKLTEITEILTLNLTHKQKSYPRINWEGTIHN